MSDTDTFERAQAQGLAALASLGTEAPPVSAPKLPKAVPYQTSVVQPEPAPKRAWYIRFTSTPWLLVGILALETALSLRLVWSNTAANDEALYLWSGHWEIAHLFYGTPIPSWPTYFSGAPVFYPVIAAVADSYLGLAGARLLSLLFMLAATTLCYLTGRRLFSSRAGLIGAALFAVLGSVQYLGAYATYDAMAIFLLAAASCLVVYARNWRSEPLLLLAAVVLTLGDAAKYPTLLWNPAVIGLVGLTAGSTLWWRNALRALRFTIYLAVLLAIALHFGGHPYEQGFAFTTLQRAFGTTPMLGIFRESAEWIGIVVLISLRAVVIAPTVQRRLLCAVLAGAAFLAPLDQAHIHLGISLEKHVAFGAWFAAIAAGYVLDRGIARSKYAKWKLAVAPVALIAVIGLFQSSFFHDGWVNTAAIARSVRRARCEAPGPDLIQEVNTLSYALHLSPEQNVIGVGQRPSHYSWRVLDHKFAVIEDDNQTAGRWPTINGILAAAIRRAGGYKLVFRQPWHTSSNSGVAKVWIDQRFLLAGKTCR